MAVEAGISSEIAPRCINRPQPESAILNHRGTASRKYVPRDRCRNRDKQLAWKLPIPHRIVCNDTKYYGDRLLRSPVATAATLLKSTENLSESYHFPQGREISRPSAMYLDAIANFIRCQRFY